MTADNEDIAFSLDEYIKQKKMKGQFSLLHMRKKERNIDKDELDAGLDLISQRNVRAEKRKTGSKFDRFNDDHSDSNEDEDDYRNVKCCADEDIEMEDESAIDNPSIQFAKEIEQMEHPDCCQFKAFRTVESELGVKVQPQQWRLMSENLDRPKGVPRLVTVPLSQNERYKKVQNGRVMKNKFNHNKVKAGIFVDKGNFTYKLDANSDLQSDTSSVVGIVRNKPPEKGYRQFHNNNNNNNNKYRNGYQHKNNEPQLNINVNFDSFFKGMTNCIKATRATTVAPVASTVSMQPPQPVSDGVLRLQKPYVDQTLQVKIAADEVLDFLLDKREKERRHQVERDVMIGMQSFDIKDNEDDGKCGKARMTYPDLRFA